jgi:transposase
MPEDRKHVSLRKSGTLNRDYQEVKDKLFKENLFFDAKDLVQVKYEMLRRVSREESSISEASKTFGFSRPSFYEAKDSFERDGLSGLIPKKPGPKKAHKLNNQIMDYIFDNGLEETKSADLKRIVEDKFGTKVHSRSIERAISKRKKKHRSIT